MKNGICPSAEKAIGVLFKVSYINIPKTGKSTPTHDKFQ